MSFYDPYQSGNASLGLGLSGLFGQSGLSNSLNSYGSSADVQAAIFERQRQLERQMFASHLYAATQPDPVPLSTLLLLED